MTPYLKKETLALLKEIRDQGVSINPLKNKYYCRQIQAKRLEKLIKNLEEDE